MHNSILLPQTQFQSDEPPKKSINNGFLETAPSLDDFYDPIIDPEKTTSKDEYISTCSDKQYKQIFKVKVSGFVKYEAFENSRQIIEARHGTILVVPKMPEYDPDHADINDAPRWNMAAIRSRIYFNITGPKLGHAFTSAQIGADFADSKELAVLRLRDAYMQFFWEHDKTHYTRLVVGQSHHPIILGEPYPTTLGYSEGILINPAGFSPQATVFKTIDRLTLIGSLNANWHTGRGQDAVAPCVFLGGEVKFLEKSFIGAGIDYHREVPRLKTDAEIATSSESFATSTSISSWAAYVAALINIKNFKMKFRWLYAENGQRYYLLGGFAAKAADYNPVTDERHYTNLRALSYWTELIYRYKKAEVGIFIGYAKNIGSKHPLITDEDGFADTRFISTFYPTAEKTDYVLRVQPRLKYYLAPIQFGLELEYCRAAYGQINKYGRIDNASPVSVARLLFVIYYVF